MEKFARSINEVVKTLTFNGFASHYYLIEEEKHTLETELFRQVKIIAKDSGANGTHFFTVPTVHRFPDGTQMPLSLNFLYNKEAAILDMHSVQAALGKEQERFLPDEQRVLPDPSIIRFMLEQKAVNNKTLKILEYNPAIQVLTH